MSLAGAHMPADLVQVALHAGKAGAQVALRQQAHGGHLDQHGLHAGADHGAQQRRLRLVPHVGQRHQTQPGAHLRHRARHRVLRCRVSTGRHAKPRCGHMVAHMRTTIHQGSAWRCKRVAS